MSRGCYEETASVEFKLINTPSKPVRDVILYDMPFAINLATRTGDDCSTLLRG